MKQASISAKSSKLQKAMKPKSKKLSLQKSNNTLIAPNLENHSEEPVLAKIIPTLKESLLFQKSSILNKTNEFKRQQAETVQLSDEAEVASNELSQNLSIHLHERDLKSLIQIEKALGKIAAGTYGECEICSDLINAKRLQVRPLATLCVSCMEDLEEERKRIQ